MRILVSILFLLLHGVALAEPIDSNQLLRWQQEGSWEQVLGAVRKMQQPQLRELSAAGFAAYQLGDRNDALRWFDRSLAQDSNGRNALYYAALIHKSEERERIAIPLLVRLCMQASENSGYFQLLGDCYAATDQDPAAAAAYQRAYTLAPTSITVIPKLATALLASKLPEQADTLLRSAMARFPGTPALLNSAISVAYALKQYDRCSHLCDSLIATTKLNYRSLLTGLYSDMARPDYKHAARIGGVLIAMDLATEDILYYTAIAHQKLGNWEAADTLLRRCAAKMIKPQLGECYQALADGAAAKGDFQRSKAYYDTVYYLFRNPVTLYRKGRMLEAHGMESAAKPVYRKYLALPRNRQDSAVSRYLRNRVGESR